MGPNNSAEWLLQKTSCLLDPRRIEVDGEEAQDVAPEVALKVAQELMAPRVNHRVEGHEKLKVEEEMASAEAPTRQLAVKQQHHSRWVEKEEVDESGVSFCQLALAGACECQVDVQDEEELEE